MMIYLRNIINVEVDMREIKFRAWLNDKARMIDVYQIDLKQHEVQELIISKVRKGHEWEWHADFNLMQFTGLLDKSGKEIYEGDILVFHLDFYTDAGDIGGREHIVENKYVQVKWEQESCSWILSNFGGRLMQDTNYEIAGNIYENPELLSSG